MRGFALMEVLFAWVLVMSSLLVGVSYQVDNLRALQQSYLEGLAVVQVESLLERLRVNERPAMRERALLRWKAENERLLLGAKGRYRCRAHRCTATVRWPARALQPVRLTTLL